jgi:hypothetical protein
MTAWFTNEQNNIPTDKLKYFDGAHDISLSG